MAPLFIPFRIRHSWPSSPSSLSCVCQHTHLSDTAARAAAGPSCWGSRCCSWARSRTGPRTRSGCRIVGGKPAAPHGCCLPTASSAPWKSLARVKKETTEERVCVWKGGMDGTDIEVRLICAVINVHLKWNSHQKVTKALFVIEYESNLHVNV